MNNISIKTTLKVLTLFVFLSFFTIAYLNHTFIEKTNGQIKSFQENDMNILVFSNDLKDILFEIQSIISYQFSLKVTTGNDNFELVEEKLPNILQKLNQLKDITKNTNDQILINISKKLNIKYMIFASKSIELFTSDIKNNNVKELFTKLSDANKATDEMNMELNKLSLYLDKKLNQTYIGFQHNINVNKYLVIFISLFIIFVLLTFFILFSNSLVKKLDKLTGGMKAFEKGDLSYRIKKLGEDELSTLGHSFNKMAHSLELNIMEKEKQHELLLIESKKVEAQAIELQQFNENLEKRVELEIEKNQQKEQLLFEQSKLASMGEMISNIAHQWRQPLSLISTAASSLNVQKEHNILEDKTFFEHTNKIIDTTVYLSQTIDDFRNYFKKSKQKEIFSIKEIINKNLTLMESSFKTNHIQVVIVRDEDAKVYGYANEFVQALLNILSNAKDALSSNKDINNKYIFIEYHISNKDMMITIKDTAGGIPENLFEKIFEPYFTTKHQSQGTGIGLYMTRQIIVDHMGGAIKVSNETFKYHDCNYSGAQFKITLPLSEKQF